MLSESLAVVSRSCYAASG